MYICYLKTCKVCKSKFEPQYNRVQTVCSYMCGIEYAKQLKAKKANRERQEYKLSDVKWLRNKIQANINEMVRIIDYGLPCTARPSHELNGISDKQFHAGHVHTRGGHPECRWNLHNIHIQSSHSNRHQADDHLMRVGIERIYGSDYLEFVNGLADGNIVKYSVSELQQIHKRTLAAKKWLKTQNTATNSIERIIQRNQINILVAAYTKKIIFKKIF